MPNSLIVYTDVLYRGGRLEKLVMWRLLIIFPSYHSDIYLLGYFTLSIQKLIQVVFLDH